MRRRPTASRRRRPRSSTLAKAHFDTALALADTIQQVKYGAAIGKARAQLSLKDYAGAAATIPRRTFRSSFKLLSAHSSASTSNGVWSAHDERCVALSSDVGRRASTVCRSCQTPTRSAHQVGDRRRAPGSAASSPRSRTRPKFGQFDDGVIANGIEGRLIGDRERAAGRQRGARWAQVFADLNTLRASALNGVAAVPAMTADSLPTSQAQAVTLFFKERAYWLWLTGHRLGDLRRLVRDYGRDAEAVFPTGALTSPLAGTYGTSTSITIPSRETNNPNFKGCLDGK